MDPQDLVGKRFAALFVQSLGEVRDDRRKKKLYFYTCVCDCGATVLVIRGNLVSGHTQSCGCLKRRGSDKNPGWKGCGKISGYFWAQIRNHVERGSRTLPFSITMQDAWQQFERQDGRCALTGWPLLIDHSSKRVATKTASLDRIDSEKGYEPGNIQWVHKDVNRMKWELSTERFIEICEAVVQQRQQNEVQRVA